MALEMRYADYKYSDYFNTKLPKHWKEKRLGFLAKEERTAFVDGPFGSDLKTSDYMDDGVPLIQLNNIRDSKHLMQNMKFVTEEKKRKLIRHLAIPGDVVIAKMADPVARSAVVSENYSEYVIVADCVKMTPNLSLVDLRYLVWAINCDHVRINAELVSTGTTRIRVNLGELKKLKVPYPPFSEQEQIANFLDHETAKIDTLIEKQQQLIKLLKEKRQAVISHAVTKGLNPNAPMRDSGVEWLGEVPERWITMPLKLIIKTRKGVAFKSNDFCDLGVRVVKASDIKLLTIRASDVFLPQFFFEEYPKAVLRSGDIVLSTVGSNPDVRNSAVGQIGMVPNELDGTLLNQNTVVYDPNERIVVREYLFYVLQMEGYRDHLDLHAHGTANQSSLSIVDMLSFNISFPPVSEQLEICSYLSMQQEKLRRLELRSEESRGLLKERRTALISAAVTGKIDVRDWKSLKENQANKE